MVLTESGLFICGGNENGELGLGDTNNRNIFVKSKVCEEYSEIISFCSGSKHVVIWTKEGLFTSGSNTFGQLGLTSQNEERIFRKIL